jgi:hypothetical protein
MNDWAGLSLIVSIVNNEKYGFVLAAAAPRPALPANRLWLVCLYNWSEGSIEALRIVNVK